MASPTQIGTIAMIHVVRMQKTLPWTAVSVDTDPRTCRSAREIVIKKVIVLRDSNAFNAMGCKQYQVAPAVACQTLTTATTAQGQPRHPLPQVRDMGN